MENEEVLPSQNKHLEVEDVVRDFLNEDIYRDRRKKWKELAELEEAMKQHDLAFKDFYPKENYWDRLNQCIENFNEIATQVPK